MYHIPDDKRAKESAHKIYKSVRKILKRKSLMDVTVMDIKNDCGISRSTFYRLFDNVPDVLEYQLGIFFDRYLKQSLEHEDRILFFYQFFYLHTDLIYIISTQSEYILKKVMKEKSKEKDEYLLAFKVGIMTSLLIKWSERRKKETPEEMADITKKLLSLNMTDLLTEI